MTRYFTKENTQIERWNFLPLSLLEADVQGQVGCEVPGPAPSLVLLFLIRQHIFKSLSSIAMTACVSTYMRCLEVFLPHPMWISSCLG